jgi:hypothetical protein
MLKKENESNKKKVLADTRTGNFVCNKIKSSNSK